MKKLLLLALVGICLVGLRGKEYMSMFDLDKAQAATPASLSSVSTKDMLVSAPRGPKNPMSAEQFAALSQTDPQAYQKFLKSYEVEEEPSAVDKLMNFLAHGKYE